MSTSSSSTATAPATGWSSLPPVARYGVLAAGMIGLLAVLAIGTLWFVQRDQALPNTEVADVAVGGMTADEMSAALEPIVDERVADRTVFTFGDEEFVLLPTDVGYEVDLDATVAAAMARGREGFPGDLGVRIRSYRTTESFSLQERPDQAALEAWVTDLADRLDREEIRGDVVIDTDDASVALVSSQGLVVVDREALRSDALDALVRSGSEELEVPAETAGAPIDNAELTALASQVETAVSEPFTFRSGDTELVLEPRDLAQLLDVVETAGGATGTTLEMTVTSDAVEAVMGEVAPGRFDVAAVNATYSASRTPPSRFDAQANATYRPVAASVSIEGGRLGARFDGDTAATQLTELLRNGSREAAIRLEEVEPELSPERAEQLRPTHAIGTFTTYFQAGAVRNQNIALLADTIDGELVMPGEQFSINAISGERSCEKGYQPAGTIVRGELVDTCGGGTSQFGTTTFNAAFFAGVALDDWKAHSWYISRYPMGREATLSFPVLDVKWTNTTDGAILVKTANTSTSVTVTLYGQPLADAVTATHGSPTDERNFSTDVRTTSTLRQGQENVVQAGSGGFTVRVTRDVALRGGGSDSQTITTVYVPQTRIVERGTRPAPTPAAEPDPEPDEDEDNDD
jgi:vancomycin resistance protein YoaR